MTGSMSLYDVAAILIGLTALFGYINYRFLRLPVTIGLVLIAWAASLAVVALDLAVPGMNFGHDFRNLVSHIDFYDAVMHGFLSFLLFAGALHVDFAAMAQRRWSIAIFAIFSTLISTFVIGAAMWQLFALFGVAMPFLWALVFGALISPTDTVAVLGVFKTTHVPRSLSARIAGESLFNDGVGVVVFTVVLAMALGRGEADLEPLEIGELFLREAVGGAALGFIAGLVGHRALQKLDDYVVAVTISLALVMTTYSAAIHLDMSGPLAMVVAGLYVGSRGVSHKTHEQLVSFWSLLDEILNSVLFLLIGLEVLVVSFDVTLLDAAALAIPLALLGRAVSIILPIIVMSPRATFATGTVPVLVWGGLRGGVAVALALSLPESAYKTQILTATYAVALFSIIVQGLTIAPLIRKVVREEAPKSLA